MNKGETLVEFLIAYWWLILVILIAGSLFSYYFILSSGTQKSGCPEVLSISAGDWNYEEGGIFEFKIENEVGETINITSVTATSKNVSVDKKINSLLGIGGKTGEITMPGLPAGNKGEPVSIKLKIGYRIPGQITGESILSCSLKGTIGE